MSTDSPPQQLVRPSISADELRLRMRRVVSPVTVVTCGSGDNARGITIGSFVSTSLDPPLITFNLARSAQMHELLPFEDRFIVHVLAENQAWLSERFAVPDVDGTEQFRGLDVTYHESGIPVIPDTAMVLDVALYNVFPAGDHSLIVGQIQSTIEASEAAPLVYYNQGYHAVGGVVDSDA